MHQDKCAASPASKQENGEKHTQRVYDITFYSRCHDTASFVHVSCLNFVHLLYIGATFNLAVQPLMNVCF